MIRPVARLLPQLRQIGGGRLEERILFLHIPKCGGTSVADAIGAAYPWRPWRQSREVHLDPAASWRGSRLAGMALFDFREKLLLYEMGRPHIRYITGHYPLSETALDQLGDAWNVVTVLRHPVDRWFSEYFYNRHKESRYFAHDQTLDEYLGSHTGRVQARMYTRWFSGELSDDWADASVDRALRNVDRLAVVGLLEDLGQFRDDFHARFGVRLRIPRLNRNPRTSAEQAREVGEDQRARVRELCADDLRIYRHVRDRIGDRAAPTG